MSAPAIPAGRYPSTAAAAGEYAPARRTGGPAAERIVVGYGFLAVHPAHDIVMFSVFFADLRQCFSGGNG